MNGFNRAPEGLMTESLRITVDDLRKRMEAGEDFVMIDTRNRQAWAESDVKLPEAFRVPADKLEKILLRIPRDKAVVTYCT
jgi:rhodanese-related sulfurtransferase